jgi:hypothetical protein
MWKSLSQVHVVEEVEPCVEFWTKRFGFQLTLQSREGDKLGFAALRRDDVVIQYRTRSNLVAEIPGLAALPLEDSSMITIELESVNEVMNKLEGVEVIIPRRTTFYGNNEVIVRAPGGQIVVFTAPGSEPTMMVANPFAKQNL